MAELGKWLWYVGSDETDDEMMQSATREQAILDGKNEYPGNDFWIVEARMLLSDEMKMGLGVIDTAPFAETRNGEFISNPPDSEESQ